MMDAVPTKGSWYSYGDHRFVAGFSREAIYRRDDFHQQIHERDRDNYACYRNDSWKRRNFCNPVCDTPRSRWERDQCPGSKGERSWSRGHDYRQRSRSPCVSSHSGSRRKHNYDSEHNHRRSSVVPSTTVKVTGLSKRATAEDLYQILAEWGPLHNVQVIQERNSSSHGGIAFINFPSVVNAGMMMSAIGYGGLVVDGAELRFEYSYKKIKSKNKQMRAKQSSQRRRRERAIERDAINGPARLQRDEEKVLAEVVEEGEVEGNEQGEVGEIEVVGGGEAEDSEEEGKVGDSEAEDVEEEAEGSEQGGEVGDSEADEVERDVEDSEEDGEAGDREVDKMLTEEGEVRSNDVVDMDEGEVRNNDVVDMDEGEGEDEYGEETEEELEDEYGEETEEDEGEVEDEYGEETDEELELGMFSTKKLCIEWTEKETKWLKKKADLLSGQRKWSVPWRKILRLGSHIFHPERTAEDLREKDRRMRGDTQRERTKRRRTM